MTLKKSRPTRGGGNGEEQLTRPDPSRRSGRRGAGRRRPVTPPIRAETSLGSCRDVVDDPTRKRPIERIATSPSDGAESPREMGSQLAMGELTTAPREGCSDEPTPAEADEEDKTATAGSGDGLTGPDGMDDTEGPDAEQAPAGSGDGQGEGGGPSQELVEVSVQEVVVEDHSTPDTGEAGGMGTESACGPEEGSGDQGDGGPKEGLDEQGGSLARDDSAQPGGGGDPGTWGFDFDDLEAVTNVKR